MKIPNTVQMDWVFGMNLSKSTTLVTILVAPFTMNVPSGDN